MVWAHSVCPFSSPPSFAGTCCSSLNHFGSVASTNCLILSALLPAALPSDLSSSPVHATVLTHGHIRASVLCAWTVRQIRGKKTFCAVLADQIHSHRSRHTCGHFLLPIRAIVARAHLRLQPIRCILPHETQEKRQEDASDSTIDAQRKPIVCVSG